MYRYCTAVPRHCAECGGRFETHTPTQITCSSHCARERKTRLQKERREAAEKAARVRAAEWFRRNGWGRPTAR